MKIIFLIHTLILTGLLNAQVPPTPVLNPGEHWTNLYSVSYDFQTNGSLRYLVQNPNNPSSWCAVLMAQQDSNTNLGNQRYIYYSYSSDNGNTWTSNVLNTTFSFGFPCITLKDSRPVIACHRHYNIGSYIFMDSVFGINNFMQIGGGFSSFQMWPHISGTSNGNLVMAAALYAFIYEGSRTTYNGTTWTDYQNMPLISGPSGNFDIASGPNGKVAIIGTDYVNETNKLAWYRSDNNGLSFDGGSVILPFVVDDGDTLFTNVVGGYQSVYDNNGNLHIVFAAYNYNPEAIFFNFRTYAFIKPAIYHWTSQNNLITKIASVQNIANLTDTLTQLAKVPLCQPTVSLTSSGKLICAFTTYLRGNTQIVQNGDTVNTGEIFYSISVDNGNSWSVPQNITNTPFIEEKHPSLTPLSTTDSLRIFYIRDMKAGDYVYEDSWGKAPVYGIFYNQLFNTIPATPLLISPLNNSVYQSVTPLLDWNNTQGAALYQIQLSRNQDFTELILNQSNINTSQFQVPVSIINYDSVYYWRVNASNSNGTGQWSSTWHFRTMTFLPPAPVLVSPPFGAIGISLTPRLDWNEAPTAESYHVQVSIDSNFGTSIIDLSNLTVSQYIIPASTLSMDTVYYWRVNSTNLNGTGDWSLVWYFKTLLTDINSENEQIPEQYYLSQNYPNPFNPITHLGFGILEFGLVSLRVYDALGKDVAVLVNEKLSPGIYESEFDGSNYPSGIYYYKLEAGDFSEVRKMILLK